ncbi:MAG: hypothetical protein HZA46_07415 [Planctomycetales bacterium]|nr:hypothetical protein [Planctomycetales bacterium]
MSDARSTTTFVQEVRLGDDTVTTTDGSQLPLAFSFDVSLRDNQALQPISDGDVFDDESIPTREMKPGLPGVMDRGLSPLGPVLIDSVWQQLGASRELGVFCDA